MQLITASNLYKEFEDKTQALKGINLSIQSGKITGLVGPDGAGKTTLMRMLTGLMAPTSGKLNILGKEMPYSGSDFLELIGYMPQKFGLYEDLSVYENLQLYAELQGIDNAAIRIKELLEFTTLTPFLSRLAGDLSGGMKQKLGLACSLIKKPKILLLDEPSVGVDPISRRELWSMVQKLLNKNTAVLWGTSYLEEADRCDEVILLNEGRTLFQGPPHTLQKRMAGKVYMLRGILKDKRATLISILELEEVLDAVLVGSNIRIIFKEKIKTPKSKLLHLGENITLEAVNSKFEDAFVDILNVKTEAHSLLTSKFTKTFDYPHKLIEAKGLTKTFGNFTATKDIDFEISKGEIFGFLGPNGAGKSTTFKMLCGLLTPTSGVAHLLGENLYKSGTKVKNSIGYMAQKFSLYANMGVKENLDFFASIYGLQGKRKRDKIAQMIDIFDFKEYLHTKAETLPLGLKQRLALACSVMHEPDILFLDEPTSGVDPITRKEFWMHINAMVQKGMSIMVTTHFMDEAEYCDRVMLIYRGKEIAQGTPDALKAMVKKEDASMEDAFIELIERYDKEILQ